MNLKIHEVISSLTGVSGSAMVRAIVGGERDAEMLLVLCDVQIRRAKAERIRARCGGLLANQALARKIATLYWNMMIKGVQFIEKGLAYYEQKIAQTEQHLLRKLASKHNLVPVQSPLPA